MIFLSAQPHDPYFQWQVEVQIVNFRKFNISHLMHICVWYPKGSTQLPAWKTISEKYPEVNMYVYEDQGVDLCLYISQLRPHILKMHFAAYPELQNEVIFYHDSDILFNFLPNFESLINGETVWQSNTTSYLDYSYMRAKENEGNIPKDLAIKKLCECGGIKFGTFKDYDHKTGGAQILLKPGLTDKFWLDVEEMCIKIRTEFTHQNEPCGRPDSINSKYFISEIAGIQSWCADMWAINFALWKRGYITNVTEELRFSWATDDMKTYTDKPIYHNAGVVNGEGGLFYKGEWIGRSPIGQDLPMPPENSASSMYVKAIKEVNL